MLKLLNEIDNAFVCRYFCILIFKSSNPCNTINIRRNKTNMLSASIFDPSLLMELKDKVFDVLIKVKETIETFLLQKLHQNLSVLI